MSSGMILYFSPREGTVSNKGWCTNWDSLESLHRGSILGDSSKEGALKVIGSKESRPKEGVLSPKNTTQ